MELYALNEAFYTLQMINPMSPGQIALWHALVRIANKSRWQEWFSIAGSTLVLLTGLSTAGVKKARNELKQHGLIDFKSNGTKATSYKLIDIADSSQDSSQNSSRNSSQDSSQDSSRNSSQNSSALNKQNKTKKDTPLPPQGEELFERFWSAYPRKTGKAAARKVFSRLKVTQKLLDDMIAAVEQQKRSAQWRRDGGQYIPHPATWLNQGRWEDEPDEPLPFCDAPPAYNGEDLYA